MKREPGVTVRFTMSELMALVDILVAYMRHPEEPQEFIDCARNVTTTTGELVVKMLSCNSTRQEAKLCP